MVLEIPPKAEFVLGAATLALKQGDLTDEVVDVIVNAANSGLLGGGGVDGAIHRAGGPEILIECKKIVATKGRCKTGDAVWTGAGKLKAQYVVHAVGPIWSGGQNREADLLFSAYKRSLQIVSELACSSVAFPAISAGAYRYPLGQAAEIALNACRQYVGENQDIKEIRFVLFSEEVFKTFFAAAEKFCS